MKRKLYFVLAAVALLVCLYSCTKDKTTIPSSINCSGIVDSNNTYSKSIAGILNFNCAYAPCHGGGSAQNGISFDGYSAAVNSFKNNNVICALKGPASGCILMPNGGPALDSATILQIECWQANGYPQ